MIDIDVPDGWIEIDLGQVKLYKRKKTDGSTELSLVYHSEYFGGVHRYTVDWIRGTAEAQQIFSEVDAQAKARRVLEMAMEVGPESVDRWLETEAKRR